jgi:hypothetical protein
MTIHKASRARNIKDELLDKESELRAIEEALTEGTTVEMLSKRTKLCTEVYRLKQRHANITSGRPEFGEADHEGYTIIPNK